MKALVILLVIVISAAFMLSRSERKDKQQQEPDKPTPQDSKHRNCASCRYADEPTDCPQCVACESYSNWSARV